LNCVVEWMVTELEVVWHFPIRCCLNVWSWDHAGSVGVEFRFVAE